jgi:predicted permease
MDFQRLLFPQLRRDIAYALRQLKRSPVFTITASLTLALGIGATTAIFSLIDSVMLKSLPVANPSTLYRIGDGTICCDYGPTQTNWGIFSYPLFLRLQAAAPEFEQMTAFQAERSTFSVRRAMSGQSSLPLNTEYVTGNYFQTFGIGAFAGRALEPRDDQQSAAPVAVISYSSWQQNYGSDPKVVGSSFIIQGHPFTIVGIAPAGFYGDTLSSDPPDLWLPLEQKALITGDSSVLMHPAYMAWLHVIGRLKPGASTSGVPARLTQVLRQWLVNEAEWPATYSVQLPKLLPQQHIEIVPAGSGVNSLKEDYDSVLRTLLGVCCLVLLIACANVANLLLARGTARRAQTALRTALGASRQRLIRQSITESLVLSLLGGAAGIALAYVGVKVMVALAFPGAQSVPITAKPSLPVLGFSLGLSLITGALFGTIPAWLASHAQPLDALRGVNRSTRDKSSRAQKTFVVLQASLSIVLLFGAGLLTRSLLKLEHQNFGFDTDHRVSVEIAGPLDTYSPDKLDALYAELQDQLSQLHGVRSAALGMSTPFNGGAAQYIIREGQDTPSVNSNLDSELNYVTPNYLDTMGQHILRGRGLSDDDTGSTRNVAVVDENFVHRFFKSGEEPLGTHFGVFLSKYSRVYEIVGIVNSANYYDNTDEHTPLFFASLAQHVHFDAAEAGMDKGNHVIEGAVLRIRGSGEGLEPQIRKVFSNVDPDLTVRSVQLLQNQVDENFAQPRLVAQVTGLFGVLALLLAAIGLYGVTAYTVAQRTSEIGVRMALGASRGNVVKFILRGAFLQVSIGLLLGIPISLVCGRLIASQLYQVRPWDPVILAVSVIALGLCALVASIIPAQRAASINPVTALRTE